MSERSREASMFERGVDLFAVDDLACGCWHLCVWLEMKAGLEAEWRLSADNFDFCLLTFVVGDEERRENWVMYDGHFRTV